MTRQQKSVADFLDDRPAIRKRLKLGHSIERKGRRPNVVTRDFRPEGYTQTFKPSRWSKTSVSYLFDGQELNYEVADGARTNIHQPVIGRGTLAFHVGGFELRVSPMSLVTAEPHVHIARNGTVKPKSMSNALGEKGPSSRLCWWSMITAVLGTGNK